MTKNIVKSSKILEKSSKNLKSYLQASKDARLHPELDKIDLTKSRFDQATYLGRLRHFFDSTWPGNLLLSPDELNKAKRVVLAHNKGKSQALNDEFPAEFLENLSVEDLFRYKNQYDSSFHPETGELQPLWGRMSSQVPMNMVITGLMVSFSHTKLLNVTWQIANQSYNSAVNFTNRSGGESQLSSTLISWSIACTAAIAGSNAAKNFIDNSKKLQRMNPMLLRSLAPFAGIVVANLINIPVMRYKEFLDGISVSTKDGEIVGASTSFTVPALGKVVIGRLCIAAACVLLPSGIMAGANKISLVRRLLAHKKFGRPTDVAITILAVGLCLFISVPPALAIFPQRVEVGVNELPAALREQVTLKYPNMRSVYYNKGL